MATRHTGPHSHDLNLSSTRAQCHQTASVLEKKAHTSNLSLWRQASGHCEENTGTSQMAIDWILPELHFSSHHLSNRCAFQVAPNKRKDSLKAAANRLGIRRNLGNHSCTGASPAGPRLLNARCYKRGRRAALFACRRGVLTRSHAVSVAGPRR